MSEETLAVTVTQVSMEGMAPKDSRDPLAQLDLQVNLEEMVPLVSLAHLDLLVHQEVVVNLALVDRVEEMEKRERRVTVVIMETLVLTEQSGQLGSRATVGVLETKEARDLPVHLVLLVLLALLDKLVIKDPEDHLALLAPAVTQDLQESRVQLDLKVHVVVTVWMVTRDTQAHEVTLVHLVLQGTAVLAQPSLIPRNTSRAAVLQIGEREYVMDLLIIHVQHAVTSISTTRTGSCLFQMASSTLIPTWEA